MGSTPIVHCASPIFLTTVLTQYSLCREDDAAARTSRLAQQREEALKRADAHAAEELQRAREHERQQVAQQRSVGMCGEDIECSHCLCSGPLIAR